MKKNGTPKKHYQRTLVTLCSCIFYEQNNDSEKKIGLAYEIAIGNYVHETLQTTNKATVKMNEKIENSTEIGTKRKNKCVCKLYKRQKLYFNNIVANHTHIHIQYKRNRVNRRRSGFCMFVLTYIIPA